MGRSRYWPFVLLVISGCDDRPRRRHVEADPLDRMRESPSALLADPPTPSESVPLAAAEGAENAQAVFARAQTLLAERDFVSLVHTIRPDTRRRWTADLAVALALDSIDDGLDPDLGRRHQKERARSLLLSFGATASVDRAEVNVSELQKKLFARVRDPDGLLAAMLMFADARQCGLDPLCALAPSGIDGVVRPEETRRDRPRVEDSLVKGPLADAGIAVPPVPPPRAPVSVPAGGIVRLFDRVVAPHKIESITFEGASGVGMTSAPEFLPVRFYTSNGITWLDES